MLGHPRHNTMADCLESERHLFEMDHCQAGLLLTQRWGFPSVTVTQTSPAAGIVTQLPANPWRP